MNIKKYITGVSAVVLVTGIGWISVEALSINNANFDKGLPIFKTIFFRSEGKDTINGVTNAEGVRIDNGGIYTAPSALPGAGSNVLKLNGASSQVFVDPVQNANIANDQISNIKIMDNSIINSNFADLAITNAQIQNNTINKVKFDPSIVWPTGGTMFITNNVCTLGNAIISTNNGTATCALLPTGSTTTLPSCTAGQQPVYSGGAWTCVTFNIGAGGGDPYRTGSTGSWIASSNPGNVGINTMNPSSMFTVSGDVEILGNAEDQVYCYATDTWVPISIYSAAVCAGCTAGTTYNPTSQLCEANSCLGSGAVDGVCGFANGQTYSSAPWKFLCSAGTATAVQGSGPWTWDCLGSNGGANVSCSANSSAGGGSCFGDITILGLGTAGSPMYAHYEGAYHSETITAGAHATTPSFYNHVFRIYAGAGPQDSSGATNVPQNLTDFDVTVTPAYIGGGLLCVNGTPIAPGDYTVDGQGGAIYGVCDLSPGFTQATRSQADADYSNTVLKSVTATFDVYMDNAPSNCHRTATADFAPGDLTAPLVFSDGLGPTNFTCGGSNYCSAYGGQSVISLVEH